MAGEAAWIAVQRVVKRAADVALSAALLVALAPLLAAIALAVRRSSPGEIVFRQERVGRGGRPFTIYKFRTMRQASPEWAHLGSYCYADDPRITRVGRLLRATSLDELPQLVNVLRGDMSFVGPRPDLPHHVARYDAAQRRRLEVRPGITGWAQVNGRNELPWARRIELDLAYLDGWSLWRDAAIFARTVKVVLTGRGQRLPEVLEERGRRADAGDGTGRGKGKGKGKGEKGAGEGEARWSGSSERAG